MTDHSDFWQDLYQQSQQSTLEVGSLPVLRVNQDLQVDAQVSSATAPWVASPAAGVRQLAMTRRLLFERPNERVELIHFGQAAQLPSDLGLQGLEILVLKGELTGTDTNYPIGTWLRCASLQTLTYHAQAGTEIYVKSGHLGAFA